jgi:hypothetical protein
MKFHSQLFLIGVSLLLFASSALKGQSASGLTTTELYSSTVPIVPELGEIHGITANEELVFEFRTKAGVKSPDGTFQLREVAAGGLLKLDQSQPISPKVNYITASNYPEGSAYYSSTKEDAVMLAGPEDQLPLSDLRAMISSTNVKGGALPSLMDYASDVKIGNEAAATTYYHTNPYVSPSGKIGYVASTNYTLEDADKAWSTPAFAYKKKIEVHKFKKELLFPAENISYKAGLTSAEPVPYATDPVSGLMSMLGGLKYKKEPGKEKSHFYEFQLLSFDRNGAVVNQEVINSDLPIQITSAFALEEGPYLNANTRAAKAFIFIGEGQEKEEQSAALMRRLFFVDASTGQLSNTTDFKLPAKHAELAGIINLSASDLITLVYFHTYAGQRGFTFLTFNAEGEKVGEQFFDNNFINAGGISSDKLITAPNFKMLSVLPGSDNRYTLVATIQDGEATANQGLFLFDYDAKGVGVAHGTTNPEDTKGVFIDDKATVYFFTNSGVGMQAKPQLLQFGGSSGALQNMLPEDAIIGGPEKAWLYHAEQKAFYLLTKDANNRGLFLHELKH